MANAVEDLTMQRKDRQAQREFQDFHGRRVSGIDLHRQWNVVAKDEVHAEKPPDLASHYKDITHSFKNLIDSCRRHDGTYATAVLERSRMEPALTDELASDSKQSSLLAIADERRGPGHDARRVETERPAVA